MKKLLLAAAFAVLVVPAPAQAGDVAMRVRDVPLGGRVLETAGRQTNFNMLGLHWIGPGSVAYRTRTLRGRWRAWRIADADEYRTGAWHDGNLEWTGASSAVQFRVGGGIHRLRSYELWSRVESAPRRTASAAQPAIVSRAAWGANEEIVRADPVIAPTIKLAIVHHTAGTNNYTPAQSAAIVRGIQVYHVKGNGWNDIGYNFLVDRYGTVYEGRGGGIDRNVVGAHALGFNMSTVGVSLMGNFSRATPTKAQQDALVKLLAWRLDIAHVDPLSTVVYTSGGNAKWRAGRLVTLRAISGHRDTGPSECPGYGTYRLLPAIAKRVSVTGLPKLYAPTVAGTLGGPIHFQARLSAPLAWSVTIADASGKTVAAGRGMGSLVDWTWHAPATGSYTWTIAAPGIRVASGTIGRRGTPPPPPLPFSLTNLLVAPSVIAPAADGSGGDTTVSFTLAGPARVTAQVLDPGGVPLGTVFDEQRLAGNNTFVWSAATLADGRYRLAVTAAAGTKQVTKAYDVVVDRTLTGLPVSLAPISPNGDGVSDSLTLAFTLTQNVPIRVDVEQGGAVLATPFQGQPGVGAHTVAWDGTANGAPLPDGRYQVVVSYTDALGEVQILIPLTIDTVPPVLTLLDLASLRFTLSEPATVTALVDQTNRIELAEPRGTFTLPFVGAVLQVSAEARDAAGNVSAVVSGP